MEQGSVMCAKQKLCQLNYMLKLHWSFINTNSAFESLAKFNTCASMLTATLQVRGVQFSGVLAGWTPWVPVQGFGEEEGTRQTARVL